MRTRAMSLSGLIAALLLSGSAIAAAPAPETIFGSQLMTEQERTVYRARMWAAESEEARAAIRAEHHEQMRARAQAQGLSLPDAPPAAGAGMGRGMGPAAGAGRGMGPGPGMGRGMGPGSGMGPGPGMGPGKGLGPGRNQ